MSEEQTKPTEGEAAPAETAPMNRAERRAAAKGKTAPTTGNRGTGGTNANRASSHAVGGTRLPRTGHKGG
ncbi:MAG TPA: hypothetical protein VGK19_03820 [Capsulimonadaceae bacterium]